LGSRSTFAREAAETLATDDEIEAHDDNTDADEAEALEAASGLTSDCSAWVPTSI